MLESDFLTSLFLIIMINIVLSGDNAVVIAVACRKLPVDQRSRAILWGTSLAVVVRVIATALAVYLLQIPYLYLIGGTVLLWISYKLLREEDEEAQMDASEDLIQAVKTIVLADLMMGLDNVLAIAGAAGGNLLLIIAGLVISIPLMVFGSQLILKAMERLPWLVLVGAGVLAWTAVKMIMSEKVVAQWFAGRDWLETMVKVMITALILFLGLLQRTTSKQKS